MTIILKTALFLGPMPPSDIRLSDLSASLSSRYSPAPPPPPPQRFDRNANTSSPPPQQPSTTDTQKLSPPQTVHRQQIPVPTPSRPLCQHQPTLASSPRPGRSLLMQVQSGPSAPRLSAPSPHRLRRWPGTADRHRPGPLPASRPVESSGAQENPSEYRTESSSYRRCLADRDNQVSIKTQKGTESDSSEDDSDDEEDDEDYSGKLADWTESFLLGGTSVSHAVLWEVSTGQTLARLQTPTARTRSHIDGPTVVWSCAVLPDGTTVLGDSTGRVTFCDGRTRVPIPGAASAPLAVVPTAATASSKSGEVEEDANRFEVRLNFRYASILLVDTVEPAVVDQEEGE
ncbi:hypothetical protein CF327_g7768, partial [Tilletia walkeri]